MTAVPKLSLNRSTKGAQSAPQILTPRSEMRERIKTTLQDYPGIVDHDALMRQKAQAGAMKLREREEKYWAWQKEMQQNACAKWAFPEDTYKDKRPVQDVRDEYIEKAQRAMAETAAGYKTWVQDMEKKRQDQLHENVRARNQQLRTFADKKREAALARAANQAEDDEKAAAAAGRYWTWLAITKDKIDRRECTCAPFLRPTGVKSVEELTLRKKEELAIECDERDRQYKDWLVTVQKPSFVLPFNKECNTVEQRNQIIEAQSKKKLQEMSVTTTEYNKWVKECEERAQEKLMAKVREKMNADAEFDNQKKANAASLLQKMADAKREQARVAEQSRREVKEMYDRVQKRPLMVEQAYRHNKVTCATKLPDPPSNGIKIVTKVSW